MEGGSSTRFAFKKHDELPHAESMNKLLAEVKFLLTLNSSLIIKPTHLVIDSHGGLRAFVMPFYPRGAMSDVPRRYHNSIDETAESSIHIDWGLKVKWAWRMAAGVAYLHSMGSYSDDIKLSNMLVSDEDGVLLIDVAPTPDYSYPYHSPELQIDEMELELTAACDVYALGVTLWALAKEKSDFEREEIPHRSWEDPKGETPPWYRQLVERCLAQNPADRPPAWAVAEACEQQLGCAEQK